jgi:D-alanyl-D-alanine carboxypeptidase (penicillin-binding protein 5/6)
MMRFIFALHALISISLVAHTAAEAAGLEIAGKAGVLMNMQTGKILWSKNKDLRLPPASTAKILTALVVLERSRPDDIATVPTRRSDMPTSRLQPGERITVRQLLYALLLESDNDAAAALATHAAVSAKAFAALMNQKARQLGALHSRFANPTGLPEHGQLTTARDLTVMTRAAMRDAEFRKIVATKSYRWQGEKTQGLLKNSNRLLDTYDGAIGVKTGNTREAGFCLVAAAERKDRALIAVILGSKDKAVWQDAAIVLDAGFKNLASAAPHRRQALALTKACEEALSAQVSSPISGVESGANSRRQTNSRNYSETDPSNRCLGGSMY